MKKRCVFAVLLAGGLGLAAWLVIQCGPLAGGQEEEGAQATVDSLPRAPATTLIGSLQEVLTHPDVIPSHHHTLLGRPAPSFELSDPGGKSWKLKSLLAGGPVVLIFYYGYHCINCVRQLDDINRELQLFHDAGAKVVAISADPPKLTRERFQQRGPFGFPVLSDPGNKVAHAYQVFRADLLRHGTFLIDRDGRVRWVNVGDAPFHRNRALLYHLAKLEGLLPSAQPGP